MDYSADRYKKIISQILLGVLAGVSLFSQSLAESGPAALDTEPVPSPAPSTPSLIFENLETLEPAWQKQMLHPQSWLTTEGDLVYAGSEFGKKIYAFNAADGQSAWERNTSAPAWSRPVIHSKNIAYCTADNKFTIRNAVTGRRGGAAMLHSGRPSKDGKMRAPSQCKAAPMPYKDFFLIISVSGSLTLLNNQAKIEKRAGMQLSSLKRTIFWADMTDCGDFMLAPSLNGSIWKIDPEHLWGYKEYMPQFKNLPPNGTASFEFRAGGVLADNIYILSSTGGLAAAIDIENFEKDEEKLPLIWQKQLDGKCRAQAGPDGNPLNAPILSPDKSLVLIATPSALMALNPKTGKIAWKHFENDNLAVNPVLKGNYPVICTSSGKVVFLNMKNGQAAASFSLPHPPSCPPCFSGDAGIFALSNGTICGYSLSGLGLEPDPQDSKPQDQEKAKSQNNSAKYIKNKL